LQSSPVAAWEGEILCGFQMPIFVWKLILGIEIEKSISCKKLIFETEWLLLCPNFSYT